MYRPRLAVVAALFVALPPLLAVPAAATPRAVTADPGAGARVSAATAALRRQDDGAGGAGELPVFQAGFSVFASQVDLESEANTADLLDRLGEMHVNSVSLVFSLFQDDWTASEVYAHEDYTPTDEGMRSFVRAAHQRGMVVMLRPTLDENSLHPDDRWRGTIEPTDRAAWFASYGALVVDYARFAQDAEVELLNIGTELISLEVETGQWLAIIEEVRSVYSGRITYSYNWNGHDFGFAQELDYVGVDAFFELDAPSGATVEQLAAAWQRWLPVLQGIRDATGKPLLLTEVGTRSQEGSYRFPWEFRVNTPLSQEDQASFFGSVCGIVAAAATIEEGVRLRAEPSAEAEIVAELPLGTGLTIAGAPVEGGERVWWPVQDAASGQGGYVAAELLTRMFEGMYVWAAYLAQGVSVPETDTDFSPLNKLAEPVIGDCYRQLVVGG